MKNRCSQKPLLFYCPPASPGSCASGRPASTTPGTPSSRKTAPPAFFALSPLPPASLSSPLSLTSLLPNAIVSQRAKSGASQLPTGSSSRSEKCCSTLLLSSPPPHLRSCSCPASALSLAPIQLHSPL